MRSLAWLFTCVPRCLAEFGDEIGRRMHVCRSTWLLNRIGTLTVFVACEVLVMTWLAKHVERLQRGLTRHVELIALLEVLLIVVFALASVHAEDLRAVLFNFPLLLTQGFDFLELLI